MRAPAFWYTRQAGWQATLLRPLEVLWRFGAARRQARGAAQRVSIPVICVGNLTVGGTGKSPTVIALVAELQALGLQPHILSRGYGGVEQGPLQVTDGMTAAQVGDEPVMLSAFAPVWVSRDRVAGAQAAAAAGADAVILDDGYQDPKLAKDLSILVVDTATGFGNGRLLPAGPLREPIESGLSRADLVLALGPAAVPDVGAVPVVTGQIVPLATGMPWAGLRVIAFAGIGRPEKVFATLRGLGVDLISSHGFGDHEPYSDAVLQRLLHEAQTANARLVTTEKDAARLPEWFRPHVMPLPVRLQFTQRAALDAALATLIR
ncbi:lipid-A-disaccharide kinase [Monaibacterium marinum]|uniref:Tetraacyldisaccharide 4'-kinase n=1 Tax=Pontivivens marinum TaxID=1690039 RepID=A0A2C9CNR1_9RHOB|nr:tetraacyldisaccharide 4'-kinase [Monaibacterium marinum]SOH92825.1 lipid-A-disaccharide kinase [Monaibacterium marinum]